MMKVLKRMISLFLMINILVSGITVYASDTETAENAETETVSGENSADKTNKVQDQEPEVNISFDEIDKDQIILNGIIVGTTDISNMTVSEAVAAVNSEVESLSQLPVSIKVDDRSIETNLAAFGFYSDNVEDSVAKSAMIGQIGTLINRYKDISAISDNSKVYDLSFGISKDTVTEFISDIAEDYTIAPVNATIKRAGEGFDLTESSSGIQIDQGATIEQIMQSFENWNRDNMELQAATIVLEPDYTYDDLKQITDCIGSFQTKLSGSTSSGKGKNVVIGAAKIDGTVIMPGQEWSIYDTLAPFTVENGYDSGTAYFNGGYVQEIGGGVCQLATTLYNAALYSEITVSERFCHQMTVGYVDISFDATVNDYGSKDLKLTNNFDFPVYIEAYYSDGNVCFNIYGVETRDPRRTLGFRSEVLSEEYPTEVVETPDPSLPAGTKKMVQKAFPEVIAKAYKQVYYDGQLIEEIYLHTDNYKASPAKYLVGTGA